MQRVSTPCDHHSGGGSLIHVKDRNRSVNKLSGTRRILTMKLEETAASRAGGFYVQFYQKIQSKENVKGWKNA